VSIARACRPPSRRCLGPLLAIVLCATWAGAAWCAAVQRIVSLAPSATEILFAVGAGPQVVGVSNYCDYPPQVRRLPRVGSFLAPNLEAIAGLRPTLIVGLAAAANERAVRGLAAMGFSLLLTREDSIAAIEQAIIEVGARTGHRGRAEKVVATIRRQIAAVQARLRGRPAPRVLMVVGHAPLVAAGDGYLGQMLELADSVNIAAGLGQSWPRLSMEYVVAQAPAVILDGRQDDSAAIDPFWRRYTAPTTRVVDYPLSPVLHPGPRIGQSLMIIAALLHPDAFKSRAFGAAVTAASHGPP
jgi:iron complex transport system substrate-binding protein